MLCRAEYGGTRQLHLAMKNYAHNYAYSTGIHQNQRISYKRALRNLTVLMFSHLVHQLENSGSVKGHRTLIVHDCLEVAAALGRYHRWQHQVNLQEVSSENANWNKIPTVAKGDYRFKYSPALEVVLEKRYSEQLLHSKGRGKLVVENPAAPGHKSVTPSGLTKVRWGDALKLHLKRTAWGEGWSVETRDSGPSIGHPCPAKQETGKPQESQRMVRPGCSPLTSELLARDEELTEVLDY